MTLKYEVIVGKKSQYYRRHGVTHRIGAPSTLWDDGDMVWREYGLLHRIDGIAYKFSNIRAFFIRGKEYAREEYESKIRSSQN